MLLIRILTRLAATRGADFSRCQVLTADKSVAKSTLSLAATEVVPEDPDCEPEGIEPARPEGEGSVNALGMAAVISTKVGYISVIYLHFAVAP